MIARTIFAFASAAALAACGLGGPAYNEPPPTVDQTVDMVWLLFKPEAVRVRAGGTVQWRNTSPMAHTVTADPEMADDPALVALPEGAETFHSGSVEPGAVWSYRFTVPGTYRYVCLPHEGQGMVGTVIVDPA